MRTGWHGSTNAPIRVLVAMMVLKEAQNLSDQKLYEDCRFNMLLQTHIV
ncbi:MAG: transposase [Methanosarcinaceae archaeon]